MSTWPEFAPHDFSRPPCGKMNKDKTSMDTIERIHEIVFGAGVYTGVYIAQNYEVKKVEDPASVVNRLVKWVDEKAKDNEKK